MISWLKRAPEGAIDTLALLMGKPPEAIRKVARQEERSATGRLMTCLSTYRFSLNEDCNYEVENLTDTTEKTPDQGLMRLPVQGTLKRLKELNLFLTNYGLRLEEQIIGRFKSQKDGPFSVDVLTRLQDLNKRGTVSELSCDQELNRSIVFVKCFSSDPGELVRWAQPIGLRLGQPDLCDLFKEVNDALTQVNSMGSLQEPTLGNLKGHDLGPISFGKVGTIHERDELEARLESFLLFNLTLANGINCRVRASYSESAAECKLRLEFTERSAS